MIMDATLQLSNAQPITADTASTNTIDLGATGTAYGAAAPLVRDIGKGLGVPLLVTVTETFNNLTSMNILIQVDDTAAFASPVVAYRSPEYTLADLVMGKRYLLPDSFPVDTNERYVRLFYDITGTAPTTGKITAGAVMARQTNTNK
jgi:hypothetical protein